MRVFIGWDQTQSEAWHVAAHSLYESSGIVAEKLDQDELRAKGIYTRQPDARASTPFSLTRFLVPYLSDYQGWSLFLDCDTLVVRDVREMLTHRPGSVWCVQHQYQPHSKRKMRDQDNLSYPRKNWSSVMLFRCSECTHLTPDRVNVESPAWLHQMRWAETVGALDSRWNSLVGYYQHEHPWIVHWTDGGPWLPGHESVERGDLWRQCSLNLFQRKHT